MFCENCGSQLQEGEVCSCQQTPEAKDQIVEATPAENSGVNLVKNQDSPQQGMNPGYQQPMMNQGYPQQGFNSGYQQPMMNQGYPQQGFNSGYQQPMMNQGYPQQGFNQGYQQPMMNQGYPQQGFNQGYQQPVMNPGYAQPVMNPGYAQPGSIIRNFASPQVVDEANKELKKCCGSPLAIVLCLLATVTFGLSLFTVIESAQYTTVSGMIGALIGVIPAFIGVIGFWVLFGGSKTSNPRMGTAGFTLLRGWLITMAVYMIIFMVLVGFAIVMLIVDGESVIRELRYTIGSNYYYQFGLDSMRGDVVAAFVIIMIIALIVLILVTVMYFKLSGSMKFLKGITYGNLYGSISMYAIVMLIIAAVLAFISMVNVLMAGDISIAFIQNAVSAAYYTIAAVALIILRGKINRAVGR